MTYTARPLATGDTLSASRDPIRTNFEIAQARFAQDHVDFNEATNAGLHKWCRFPEQVVANLPAAVADISTVYAKQNTYSNLHIRSEGGQEFQLTTMSTTGDTNVATFGTNTTYLAANPGVYGGRSGGWTFLPGGLILMYGRADAAGTAGTTVQFPFPFPSTNPPFSIIVTSDKTAAANVSNPGVEVGTATASQFVYVNSNTKPTAIYWQAIGN